MDVIQLGIEHKIQVVPFKAHPVTHVKQVNVLFVPLSKQVAQFNVFTEQTMQFVALAVVF